MWVYAYVCAPMCVHGWLALTNSLRRKFSKTQAYIRPFTNKNPVLFFFPHPTESSQRQAVFV